MVNVEVPDAALQRMASALVVEQAYSSKAVTLSAPCWSAAQNRIIGNEVKFVLRRDFLPTSKTARNSHRGTVIKKYYL